MTVIDPGHSYELEFLDHKNYCERQQTLTFVKRMGEGYPGNTSAYPGTVIQEVLRALLDRFDYLNNQIPCEENIECIIHLKEVLYLLEKRAAIRHGRTIPMMQQILNDPSCINCLHTGYMGECL